VLQAALDYSQLLSFAVFPVGADCRQPLTEHGYKDASRDPDAVRRLWAGRERANMALATGHVSGVFVLDVDVKGADGFKTLADLEATHGSLPLSWRSKTPSDGAHLYFRQPERALRNRVNFRPGLDVRTDGGSVALPPSRKPHGGYSWLIDPLDGCELADAPEWLLDIIDPPQPPAQPYQPMKVTSTDRAARYVAAAVDRECGDLSRMGPNTGRNLKLFQAAANLGQLVGAGLLPQALAEGALERAATECGLWREDGAHAVRASISSGIRKGIARPREVRA
jgi:putative DNA primase/helicase